MSEYLLSIEQRKRVVALALVTALGAGACGGAAEGAEDSAMDYVPDTTTSIEVATPDTTLSVNGVEIPEMLNDYNQPFDAMAYSLQLLELGLRNNDAEFLERTAFTEQYGSMFSKDFLSRYAEYAGRDDIAIRAIVFPTEGERPVEISQRFPSGEAITDEGNIVVAFALQVWEKPPDANEFVAAEQDWIIMNYRPVENPANPDFPIAVQTMNFIDG